MKKTGKIFGIVVLATAVLFAAACATAKSDGGSTTGRTSVPGVASIALGSTYSNEDDGTTITFRTRTRFVMVFAIDSPYAEDASITGQWTQSGDSLLLEFDDGEDTTLTIIDDETLEDDDGVLWIK